ncbi:MAG: DUF4469 domain-containing protein [Spirochaetales bacterium]|nr:DUF4469 domain-containing protein [Spirochaetales bacterium]
MATNIKTVAYSLYENKLQDPAETGKVFCGRIRAKGTVEQKDLVDMIHERNTTVTREEVTSVLNHLEEVVKSSIRMGYNVHTGIFNIRLSMKGVFESMSDEYDANRHRVMLNVNPNGELKDFVESSIVLEKTKPTQPTPLLFNVYDFGSDSSDGMLTPGHVIELTGSEFQLDLENGEQGVYFVHNESGERFRSERIREWSAKKITCLVPGGLEEGSYSVEVVCGFGATLRTAVLGAALTIGEGVTA